MRSVFGIRGIRQTFRQIDAGAVGLVHERRQFAGQQPGAIGGTRRAAFTLHCQDQRGQRRQPLHRLHGRWQVEGAGQGQRRLIQRTQSSDAR